MKNKKHRIELMAENNVEITPIKTITNTAGDDVEIYDEEAKESYGQDRLDEEMPVADKDISDLETIGKDKFYADEMKKRTDKKDKLIVIKEVMNAGYGKVKADK